MKKEYMIIGAYILAVLVAIFAIYKVMQKFGLIDDGTQATRDDLLKKDLSVTPKEKEIIYKGVPHTYNDKGQVKQTDKTHAFMVKKFPSFDSWTVWGRQILEADGNFIDNEQDVIGILKQFKTSLEFRTFATYFQKIFGKDLLTHISSFMTGSNLADVNNIINRLK